VLPVFCVCIGTHHLAPYIKHH